jgi:regulator of replication initiation timing
MYWDEPDVKADDEITTLRTENAKLLCRISELEQENGRLEGNVEGLQAQLTAKLSDETTMLKIENERLQRLQEMKAAKLDYNEAEKILITALAEYEKEAK